MNTNVQGQFVSPNDAKPNVSRRYIQLTREDLIESNKIDFFDDISAYDFKISIDEINKAEKIVFVDGAKEKILKQRRVE